MTSRTDVQTMILNEDGSLGSQFCSQFTTSSAFQAALVGLAFRCGACIDRTTNIVIPPNRMHTQDFQLDYLGAMGMAIDYLWDGSIDS